VLNEDSPPALLPAPPLRPVHPLFAEGGSACVVKLTAKERSPGAVDLDEFRLYDLKSEKEMPTGTSTHPPDVSPASSWPAVSIS